MALSNPQRMILNGLSMVLIVTAAIVIVQNVAVSTPMAFLTVSFPAVSLGLLLLVVGAALVIGVSFKMWDVILTKSATQSQISRKAERLEISAESSSEKVKALEQKIQTLEKALQTALSSSSRKE